MSLACLQASIVAPLSQTEMKEEKEEGKREYEDAADNSRQHQQRQINLLDHIDAMQDEVSHRMDFIEKELDGKMVARLRLVYFFLFYFFPSSGTDQICNMIV